MELLLWLISGAMGGNIGGVLIKKINLGVAGNTLSGMIGGGMGNQILQSALGASSTLMSSLIGSIAGGMLMMALLGIIKRSLAQAS